MDSEGRFHVTWIGLVCVTIICITAFISICTINSTRVIGDMVSKGADPLRAACAIDHNQDCQILYAKSPDK